MDGVERLLNETDLITTEMRKLQELHRGGSDSDTYIRATAERVIFSIQAIKAASPSERTLALERGVMCMRELHQALAERYAH